MKKIALFIVILFFIFSCSEDEINIFGTWVLIEEPSSTIHQYTFNNDNTFDFTELENNVNREITTGTLIVNNTTISITPLMHWDPIEGWTNWSGEPGPRIYTYEITSDILKLTSDINDILEFRRK
ncbi:MAG: hypothetical protein KAR07_01040 [Spirochaetes bacterium]|nr:hypothetical protein [Spirochaetota bacterium]